jgi:ABC-type spermidine/putrescine transport system permease subunit I
MDPLAHRTGLAITVGGMAYLGALLGVSWLSQATGCADADAVAAGCPAWLLANPFWSSYWSNLTSTIAGVALGLPIALYLDRKAGEQQRDFEHRAELRRRSAILEMLR